MKTYLLHVIRYIVNVIVNGDPGPRSIFAITLRDILERIANNQIRHPSNESRETETKFIRVRGISNMCADLAEIDGIP